MKLPWHFSVILFFGLIMYSVNGRSDACSEIFTNEIQFDNQWSTPLKNPFENKTSLNKLGISIQNEHWRDLQYPDSPGDGEYQQIYVNNIILGLKIFADKFATNGFKSLKEFKKLLFEVNRTTFLGEDPSNPYGGYNLGSYFKTEYQDFARMAFKIGEPLEITEGEYMQSRLEEIKTKAGSTRDEDIVIDIDDLKMVESWEQKKIIVESLIQIGDLTSEMLPKNEISYEIFHEYPKAKFINSYVKKAHNILKSLRTCTSCSRYELVKKLATYYHTMINAHYFARINQSIFMAQVNFVLLQIGLSGIKHASTSLYPGLKIDYAAMIMSEKRFVEFFISEVYWADKKFNEDKP